MRKWLALLLLFGLGLGLSLGCSTHETGPKKIDRDPFKERNMKAPRP
jgi:hypothetical protein